MSLCAAFFATMMGGTIGWLIGKSDVPLAGGLKLLFLIPLLLAPYYLAVSWKDVFNIAGITQLQGKNWIVVFVHVFSFFPLPMLMISSAFANLHRNVTEAGLLTAGRLKVLLTIELPLIKHAIFSSFILVFILSVSEMAVATFFLTPTFASDIFIQFAAFYEHEAAIAASVLLVLLCFLLLAFESAYFLKSPFLSIGTGGNPVEKFQLNQFRIPVFILMLTFWSCIVLLPVAASCMNAFKPPPKFVEFKGTLIKTEGGGETGYYLKQAFEVLQPAIPESLLFATAGALVICLLGFVFGYFSERKKVPHFDFALLLTFAVPAAVLGIGFIHFYNRPVLEAVYASPLIILLAYAGRFTFIATKIIGHAIGKIPAAFEEAALLTGKNTFQRFISILFPLLLPGFFAAFIISFVFCLNEVGTSIVIYPPGTSLLPVKIATSMHNTPEPFISALVFIALMITFVVLGILFALYHFITRKKPWMQG